MILDLARDTGLAFEPQAVASAWAGFPIVGRDTLLNELESGRTLRFGQLLVSRDRVWHGERSRSSRSIQSPAALRQLIREAPFRPLPSSADMPGNWHVALQSPSDAHAVLETVYPGMVADWAASQKGKLKTTSLRTLSQRQLGMFREIDKLSPAVIQATAQKICGSCVRHPSWLLAQSAQKKGLPCREACNLWLSAARKRGEAA